MSYKVSNNIVSTIILVVLVLVINLFFGDLLQAKISTWHWVQKYNLVNPRVPLVINTREEIRSSDANDLVSAVSNQKNKIVAVVAITAGARTLLGSAVAVTSDGVYLTSKLVVGDRSADSFVVVQSDGKQLQVKDLYFDPATSLVLIKTTGAGLSVASLSDKRDVVAGERVMLLGAESSGEPYVLSSVLSGTELMLPGVMFSDVTSRTIPLQAVPGAVPGQAVLDLSGALVGIWDGTKMVPGSVAEELLASFINSGKVVRPKFGFYYRYISKLEAEQVGTTAGLRLTIPQGDKSAVVAGSPASLAGLVTGDVVTRIAGTSVEDIAVPEVLLSSAKPNAKLSITVNMGGKSVDLTITPN